MLLRMAVSCLVFALLCACDRTVSTQPGPDGGVLQSAQVQGSFESLAVGDSIEFSAGFTSTGDIDTSLVRFAWRLAGSDSVFMDLSESEVAKLIPKQPGTYKLYLDVSYGGKTVSALIIFVVTEKIVFVDSSRAAQLKTFNEKLPGHYVGTVTTPWIPPYEIAMIFRADGSYSAYTTDSSDTPAFYNGMDADDPGKIWSLEDVRADGNAIGKIIVVFDMGSTVADEIESMRFDPDFKELRFSLVHLNQYGPIDVSLRRIDADSLPPRK